MRLSTLPIVAALAVLTTFTSCVGPAVKPAPTPASPPVPRPAPPPPPAAPVGQPAPQGNDWTLRPATPGNWTYRVEQGGSAALFGPVGTGPLVTMRCEKATRRIHIVRAGPGAGPMILRTSYGAVSWPVAPMGTDTVATRSASDAALDQIAYSRGRFAIEVTGAPPLILPAWAEAARVIEDCRD